METLGWVLAVVLVVVAAVAWWRAHKISAAARARQVDLERQVEGQTLAAWESAQRVAQVNSTLEQTQAELAEAIRVRDEKAVAKAIWKLELDRTERQWADVMVLASKQLGELTVGEQLNAAIHCEVDRLREEVGVAIRFEGGIEGDIDVEVALGALRITCEVLSIGAKMADEINLTANATPDDLSSNVLIIVECLGWESDPFESEVTSGATSAAISGTASEVIDVDEVDEADETRSENESENDTSDESQIVDLREDAGSQELGSMMDDLVGVASKLNGSLNWLKTGEDSRRAVLELSLSKQSSSSSSTAQG